MNFGVLRLSENANKSIFFNRKRPSILVYCKRQTTHLTQNERHHVLRRKKADLHARVNDNLKMEFTGEGLTSYAGLELLMRFAKLELVGQCGLWRRFRCGGLCRVLLGLLWVGGRRLRHLDFLKGDPLLQRFCGLTDLPTPRSVSTFLRRFSDKGLNALKALNARGSCRINLLRARKLTIDVDRKTRRRCPPRV